MKKYLLIFVIALFVPMFLLNAETPKNKGLRITPRDTNELNLFIESKKRSFEKEIAEMDEVKASVYRNQNKMRAGAQNLMIMENMIDVYGGNILEISESINENTKETLVYEEQAIRRNGFIKFLFGQKSDLINIFSEKLYQQKSSIEKLRKEFEKGEYSDEIRILFEKQLIDIESEFARQESFLEKEKSRKGILSWLINIFK